jgi:streptogramin lyase
MDPISVDGFPVGLAIHDHDVSMATRLGERLVTIDKATREEVSSVSLGGQGEDVVTTGRFAWVTLPQEDLVAKVSLDDERVVDTIPVGDEPRGIAVSNGALWVADLASGQISNVDPATGDVTDTDLDAGPEGPAAPTDIAFGEGSLWVTDRDNDRVVRIDAGGQDAFGVGDNPKGVVVFAGDVWVANTGAGTVSRLTTSGETIETIDVGGMPRGLAAGFGRVWVANGGDPDAERGFVSAIDPDDTKNVESLDLPGSPEEVAVGPERMWVTTGAGDELVTIDP